MLRTIFISIILVSQISAQRAIPDNNLAYPVLIILDNGSTGTGFYFSNETNLYFVTAKHVLFDTSNTLRANSGSFISISDKPKEKGNNHLKINLKFFFDNNNLRYSADYDVSVMKIGEKSSGHTNYKVTLFDSIKSISNVGKLIAVNETAINKYEDVLISNDVFIFGYPTSIGISNNPQIDFSRPLLRKGIVAGKNDNQKTIILDCPVYYGNSGGPVLEVIDKGAGRHEFRVIGVVSQFVPFAEVWYNRTHKYTNINFSNSGYSVCISMDVVLDMIK